MLHHTIMSRNHKFDGQLLFRRGVKQFLPEGATSLQRNSINKYYSGWTLKLGGCTLDTCQEESHSYNCY